MTPDSTPARRNIALQLVSRVGCGGSEALLSSLLHRVFPEERVIVLSREPAHEHDCGDEHRVRVVSPPKGCPCCEGERAFIDLLGRLREEDDVDRILIPLPSKAEPSRVLHLLFALPDGTRSFQVEPTFCSVDVPSWSSMDDFQSLRARPHLKAADLILLENFQGDQKHRGEVESGLRETNPRAWILTLEEGLQALSYLGEGAGENGCTDAPPGYSSFCFTRAEGLLPRVRLEQLLRRLPTNIFRIHGVVATDEGDFRLNFVAGMYDLEPVEDGRGCRLTFLGRDLQPGRLLSQLGKCFEAERIPAGANVE